MEQVTADDLRAYLRARYPGTDPAEILARVTSLSFDELARRVNAALNNPSTLAPADAPALDEDGSTDAVVLAIVRDLRPDNPGL